MLNGRTLSIGFVMAILSATQAVAGDGQVLQILVSRNLQSLKVYDGDKVVATSKVSTGKPGHDTPTGIFSVLEKQKFHRSNKYSDAPMPWMQRITWSGVALHESNSVPNYPASHGCVRMPAAFAQELYKMTERGAHVIITDAPVTPERVRSAMLPRPAVSPVGPAFMSDVAMTPVSAQNLVPGTELAMNDAASQSKMTMRPDKPREPIYVLITRADHRSVMPEVQALLNQFGYDAGVVDGAAGTQTNAAIAKFRKDNGLPDGVMADDALVAALFAKAGRPLPQNGILVVRRNFAEIYRAPVTIDNEPKALGTHFIEARNVDPRTGFAEWYGFTLSNRIPDAAKKRLGITEDADAGAEDSVANALDRVHMSEEARLKLGELLGEGSSITVTDVESLSETGLGTNFITLTEPTDKVQAAPEIARRQTNSTSRIPGAALSAAAISGEIR
ncbi:L,D-transpeptidase family protein [Rhizobium sp. C1]|uniref:L,D-transpeptidase family protein n=1 Tax=Rhizobium sp. C1 TaxID=1349799 RepID=UPI001E603CC1|nr:L,D-transpeptidase family protein [Rhizobium sp. C1]MCD2177119.1 L,D-transpeptidase family protein [Rhizobium sp. C1]